MSRIIVIDVEKTRSVVSKVLLGVWELSIFAGEEMGQQHDWDYCGAVEEGGKRFFSLWGGAVAMALWIVQGTCDPLCSPPQASKPL